MRTIIDISDNDECDAWNTVQYVTVYIYCVVLLILSMMCWWKNESNEGHWEGGKSCRISHVASNCNINHRYKNKKGRFYNLFHNPVNGCVHVLEETPIDKSDVRIKKLLLHCWALNNLLSRCVISFLASVLIFHTFSESDNKNLTCDSY